VKLQVTNIDNIPISSRVHTHTHKYGIPPLTLTNKVFGRPQIWSPPIRWSMHAYFPVWGVSDRCRWSVEGGNVPPQRFDQVTTGCGRSRIWSPPIRRTMPPFLSVFGVYPETSVLFPLFENLFVGSLLDFFPQSVLSKEKTFFKVLHLRSFRHQNFFVEVVRNVWSE
jgi:hypothetical protein